jgi:hypothetical protein
LPAYQAITDVKQAKQRVCEECVKIHASWMHLRNVPAMRRHAVLRQLAESPREQARPRQPSPGHRLGGTGRAWLYCFPDDAFAEY